MIKKAIILLLVISVFVDVFFSNEISFVIAVSILPLILVNQKFILPKVDFIFYAYFSILILAATIGVSEFEVFNVFKDFWYFIKPIVFVFLGYNLFYEINESSIEKLIITVSIVAAIKFILIVVFISDSGFNVDDFRDQYGKGNIIYVLGILLCITGYKFKSRVNKYLIVAVLMSATLLSYSRYLLLLIIILYFIKFFTSYKIHKATLLSIAAIIVFMSLPADTIYNSSGSRETFADKIFFSINEIKPQRYLYDSDIHSNWRGYETFTTAKLIGSSSGFNILFGNGFGSFVPVDFAKRSGNLDDVYVYTLEWLHNGYMTVLLKTGFAGLLICISFFFIVFFHAYNANEQSRVRLLFLLYVSRNFYICDGGGFE